MTMILVLLVTIMQGAGAQTDFGNMPEKVDASDAKITKMGHLTMTVGKEVVMNTQTQENDTIVTVKKTDWGTESGTAQKRMAQRRAKTYFENQDDDWWLDIWWFTYEYPSVNADGEPVMLRRDAQPCPSVSLPGADGTPGGGRNTLRHRPLQD